MEKEIEGVEEQELFEHYNFVVDKGQSLLRIDKFLTCRIENISRNKIQNAAHADCILVNGKPVKPNYKVKPGDEISIVMANPPREIELLPENIPLTIVYEDDDLIIVDKPAGMVVHPAYGNYKGTLVNALLYHFGQLPKKSGDDMRPGLVHRIDKNTSGLLVVAKNELTQARLSKYFFNKDIDRKYIALVWGSIDEGGTITGHIGRSQKDRKVMAVFPDGNMGKHAVTHYKVIENFGYVTLVECELETGRTHQIRVHFKFIGHPVFNDEAYGGDMILKGTTFSKYRQFIDNCFNIMPRHALHAKSLGFKHPCTGEYVYFESKLPSDMHQVIDKWTHYVTFNKPNIENIVTQQDID